MAPRRRRRRRRDAWQQGERLAGGIVIVVLFLVASHFVDIGGEAPGSGGGPVASGPAQRLPPRPPRNAKQIVEAAVAIAAPYGTRVCSSYRPNDRTEDGGYSDHSENGPRRAARDIGVPGVHCRHGPPPRQLDRAAVAIGKYFGRSYKPGAEILADNFIWRGYRVQIIWRTPLWGDHRGHIHIGACLGCPL